MKPLNDDDMQTFVDDLADVVLRHANGRTDVALAGLASVMATLLASSGCDAASAEPWFDLIRQQRAHVLDVMPSLLSGGGES